MDIYPDVMTTTQVSRAACEVSPALVQKWIDKGLLKGYAIPPGNHRRVRKTDLIEFMKQHNIPIPEHLQ